MDELIEVMARAAFERRHKGARNCYAWDDFWEENEYQRKHYMNEAQAALAAIKANGSAVVRGWQDIASAPRDGTPLLLKARCKTATASALVIGWYIEGMGWIELAYTPNHPVGIVPEMWMPLPDAPLTAAQEPGEGRG
jgi:hypothetical protein